MFQKYTAEQLSNLLTSLESGEIKLNIDISQSERDLLNVKNLISEIKEVATSEINFKTFMEMGAQFDKYTSAVAKAFGTSKKDAQGLKEVIAESYEDIARMGGKYADIIGIQESLTKNFKTNVIATEDIVKDLYAVNKVTNVSATSLIEGFRSAGFHTTQIKKEMQNVVDYSRSVGINVGVVAKDVTENIGKLNLYNFDNGVQGLAKMAAHSTTFGIDMRTTFKIAEDLLSPEKAIDLSASLQRLGVVSSQLLDPLKAMDLAQNDPEELQKQLVELSKQFLRTKEDGSFEILPGAKRQMREVAGALGMTTEEFAKMTLQSADANKKLSEMRLPKFDVSEEQKMMIANMAKLNKDKKYEVSFTDEDGKKQTKAIEELNERDLEMLKQMSEADPLEILAKDQLTELEKIRQSLDIATKRASIGFAASGMYTIGMGAISEKVPEKLKTRESDQEVTALSRMMTYQKSMDDEKYKETLSKFKQGGDIKIEDVVKLFGPFLEGTLNNLTVTLNSLIEGVTGQSGVASNVGQTLGITSENVGKIITGIASLVPKIEELITSMTTFMGNVFDIDDFIISQGKLLNYNENDLIIGGTHLMDVKEPVKVEERLREKEVVTNNTISEKTKEIEKNVKIDFNLEPLTKVMSTYAESYEHLNKMLISYSENLNKSIKPINEPNDNISGLEKKAQDLLDQMSTDKNINRSTTDTTPKNTNIIPTDYKSPILKNEIVEKVVRPTETPIVNPQSNMGFNTMMEIIRNQEKPIVNVDTKTPIVNVTPPINREITRVTETPAMGVSSSKMEFSDLNVRITLDIPNANNIDKTKIQSVLEETMATIDFKQKMVEAVNAAKTNMGVTATSGTANYGALKQNYGMV